MSGCLLDVNVLLACGRTIPCGTSCFAVAAKASDE